MPGFRAQRLAVVIAVACALPAAAADPPPDLGAAASFVVLGATAVVNSGSTIVSGNVGVSPGSSISGFEHVQFVVGDIFANDATARQAHRDAAAAYAALLSSQSTVPIASPPSPVGGTGAIVYRFNGDLLVPRRTRIGLNAGAISSNVFWLVTGSVTLGEQSSFVGTILASGDIKFERDASLSGRALSVNGAVTSDTDNLTFCCDPLDVTPATLPSLTMSQPYHQTLGGSGGTPPYTFAMFDGALPAGLTLAPDGTIGGTPTSNATTQFTVRVRDSHGCSDLRTYTICGDGTLPVIQLTDATMCVKYTPDPKLVAGTPSSDFPSWLSGNQTPPAGVTDYSFSVSGTNAASGCPFTQPYTLHVKCGIVAVPQSLPKATIGEQYTANIVASCGVAPFSYEVLDVKDLPPGLGPAISGIPTQTGKFTFTVRITGSAPECTTEVTYTIEVVCGALSLSPGTLPGGDTCTPYDETIAVSGGLAPYEFDVRDLPQGISWTPMPPAKAMKVRLFGTPSATGTFNVKITATDSAGCTSAETTFPITIAPPAALTLIPASLPPGCIGMPYNATLTTSCGTPTFSITNGMLPDGLMLLGGVISGTPTPAAQSSTFTITATAQGVTGSRTYTINVAPPIAIQPSALPDGDVGVMYDKQTLSAGPGGPFAFTPSTPANWLTLYSNGDLRGLPTVAGVYPFTVTATDTSTGCSATKDYKVTIRPPCGRIQITSPTPQVLASGQVGMPYNPSLSQTFTASGVLGYMPALPLQFTVPVTPTLPPGLMLSSSGILSGTPTAIPNMPMRFNFAVRVTDANGATNCSQVYEIRVAP